MLFYFDDVAGLPDLPRETVAAALSDLIRAHRSGHHLVVINRASAMWLTENIDLSQRDAAMLSRIAQDFTQTGDLRRRAKVYVNLSTDRASNLIVNGNAIFISLDRLTQYRLLDRAVLLIENLESDGDLYQYLLENHCTLYACNSVSFERQHGGGADLPKVLGHLVGEFKIVCAVVDSDRPSPMSNGVKFAQLTRIQRDSGWPFCFVSSPPCHESENIVPMSLVMSLPSGVRNRTNAVLLEIEGQEKRRGHALDHRYWLFFDVKEGLTADKFGKMEFSDKKWISSKLELAKIDPFERNIEGYGDNIVRQIFSENRFQSELRKLTRHHDWQNIFSSFLEDFVWILAASKRVVT
jgi:hypothetical protein